MKIYYNNDERQDVVVRVMDGRYDVTTATGDSFTTLKPFECKEFDVQIPEGAILYIKKWPKMVMFSFYYQSTTDQKLVEQPQDRQDSEP